MLCAQGKDQVGPGQVINGAGGAEDAGGPSHAADEAAEEVRDLAWHQVEAEGL